MTLKVLKIILIVCLILPSHTILFSQKVESFSISPCDKDVYDINLINERIADFELKSDTLKISLDIVDNCSLKPTPTVALKKDTLQLEINNSSDLVDLCNCCYELSFVISGISEFNPAVVSFENKVLIHHQNKLIPLPKDYKIHDTTEFNQLLDNKLKTGFWKEDHKEKGLKTLCFYEVSNNKSKLLWRKTYDLETNELKAVLIRTRTNDLWELTPQEYEEVLRNRR